MTGRSRSVSFNGYLITEEPGFVSGTGMPWRAGNEAAGHYAHISCSYGRERGRVCLSHVALFCRINVCIHRLQGCELAAVNGEGVLNAPRKEDPTADGGHK